MLGEAIHSNSSGAPAPHYVCLNGTMNNVQVRCSVVLLAVALTAAPAWSISLRVQSILMSCVYMKLCSISL
jgi:hypothetical protein